jgi:agmatine deiminase
VSKSGLRVTLDKVMPFPLLHRLKSLFTMNRSTFIFRLACLCLIFSLSHFSGIKAQKNKLRIPADWESQEAIWIGFRTMFSLDRYDPVILEVIRTVQRHNKVKILVESPLLFPEGLQFLEQQGIDLKQLEVLYHTPGEIWLRDPGPVFAKDDKGQLVTLDFQYTGRRNIPLDKRKAITIKKGDIDRDLGQMVTPRSKKIDLVMEGGAMHTNGKGTFILVEALTLKRNPHLNKQQIEKRLREALEVHQIIWLKQGLAEDPGTNGHIVEDYYGSATGGHVDEFVRFVNDSTILLSWVPEKDTSLHPIYAMNYHRLNDAYKRLREAKTLSGRPFTITRIPHPDLFYEELLLGPEYFTENIPSFPYTQEGDTIKYVAAASYINYLITNNLIILPTYYEEGGNPKLKKKDEQVYNILRHYFPDREIVRINPLLLNFHGGGIHCIYQEEPSSSVPVSALEKLFKK